MSVMIRSDARPRAADLWGLAFSAMRQQKVRTALTLIGVIVGTLALFLSLAVGRGIDRAIVNLFHENDQLRQIVVSTQYEVKAEDMPADRREPKGEMSDAKRERIRKALMRNWNGARRQKVKLTLEAIRKIGSIEHVAVAVPAIRLGDCKLILAGKGEHTSLTSVAPGSTFFRDRLIAGRMFAPDDGRVAIVHEYLLYRWGLVSDSDVESALGRTFRLEFHPGSLETFDLTWVLRRDGQEVSEPQARALESALKRLAGLVPFLPIPADERSVLRELFERVSETSTKVPQQTITDEFTIVGVLREQDEKDRQPMIWRAFGFPDDDVLIPTAAATAFVRRIPKADEEGFDTVLVTVDREEAVKDVALQIKGMGFEEWSLADVLAMIRLNVLLVSAATALVALVALVVAAIGITNTMIMSVLERTHEIGVMKALGARDGHIRLIFVIEGVLMGLVGSALGLAIGWLASFPGDSIAKSFVDPQTHQPLKESVLKESVFAFPIWLVVGVPALVCLITTLAAWYPASRAARVDPVTSLRHE
jgi:putative ABC transport system permease protein